MAISPAPSAPPTSVSVSEVTSSSITVQWGPVACADRNGDITGYLVRYKETMTGPTNIPVSDVTEYTIIDLKPSTAYTVRVGAVNSAGRKFSDHMNTMTEGIHLHLIYTYLNILSINASVVAVPVLLASAITATSISLSWTSAGSEAVSYEVMWETDDIGGCSGGSDMNSTTIPDGSTSYDIMGLEEDSSYTITVTASNSAGSSAVSNTVTAMTLEAGER